MESTREAGERARSEKMIAALNAQRQAAIARYVEAVEAVKRCVADLAAVEAMASEVDSNPTRGAWILTLIGQLGGQFAATGYSGLVERRADGVWGPSPDLHTDLKPRIRAATVALRTKLMRDGVPTRRDILGQAT